MSKKKKIILAVVIIVAIAAVSVGFFLKGKQLWKKTQKTKTENSRFTDLSFPNTDRQKD